MAWDWDKLQQQKRSSGGGGGVPPQMGGVFNKIKGVRGRFLALWLIVIILFLIYLGSSCFYRVAVDEVGIVQRFGKYDRTTSQGLNFKLPSGIEKATNVKVTFVYKEEFGFRTAPARAEVVGNPRTIICPGFGRLDVKKAAVIVLHEALHFAGLPESPPTPGAMSSSEINDRIADRCGL